MWQYLLALKNLQKHPFIGTTIAVVSQFWHNQGLLNASALTYTTLFAVVPMMTVTYAMLSAIPSFSGVGEQLQAWIFENFVPSTGTAVKDYLAEFSQQARSLTAVGIAALAVTSIMMIKNIEAAFNRIWRIQQQRKGVSSFLLYWAVLSLGPLLVGLGLVISSYIASLSIINSATELVGRAKLLSLIPMFMSAAAFTLIYIAVPNCRVPFRSAVVGGVVVAILFEMAKRGFALFVTQFPSYQLIYGAFAAFPLFLLWIYVSWVIILMGCELTRLLSIRSQALKSNADTPHLYLIIAVLEQLWQASQRGDVVSDKLLFKSIPDLTQSRWDDYQQLLMQQKLIVRTEQSDYALSKDLSTVSLYELAQSLPWPVPNTLPAEHTVEWHQQLQQSLDGIDSAKQQALAYSIDQLFLDSNKP